MTERPTLTITLRTAVAIASLIAATLLFPAARPVHAGEVEPGPQIQALAERASDLRNLEVLQPLQYGQFADREELEVFIEKYFDESFPPELLGPLNRTYRRLGLAEMNEEFRKGYTDMVISQVAGLYDHLYEKKMYIIWDLSPDIWMVQVIFIHEIVHALQDQHFDLSRLPLDNLHNDDAASAAQALVEGDATYTMMLHQPDDFNPLSLSADMLLMQILSSSEVEGGNTPYILQKRMLAAYLEGQKFVTYLFEHGDGFETVNAAYDNPPVSTEQILHPEKYLTDTPDLPTPIEIPDVTAALGADWRLVYHNNLGELGVGGLLETELLLNRSIRASEGWDGDWYGLFEKDGQPGEGVLVMESVWDTDKDAAEFLDAMAEYSAEKAGREKPRAGERRISMPYEDGRRLLVQEGDRVLVLDGDPADLDKVSAVYASRYPALREDVQ